MLDEINENPAKRRKKLEQEFKAKESSLRDISEADWDDDWYLLYFGCSSIIGFSFGFIRCTFCTNNMHASLGDYLSTWIVTGIVTTILCALAAILFTITKTRLADKNIKSLDNQLNEMCASYEKAFNHEKDRVKKKNLLTVS